MSRIESFSVHCLCDTVSSTSEDGRPRIMCCSGVTRKLAFYHRIRLSVYRERRCLKTHEFVLRCNLGFLSRKGRVVLEHVRRHPVHGISNYLNITSRVGDNYQSLIILQMGILFQHVHQKGSRHQHTNRSKTLVKKAESVVLSSSRKNSLSDFVPTISNYKYTDQRSNATRLTFGE